MAVDLGRSIDVARRNLPPQVLTVQADAERLPERLGTTVEVLQHLNAPMVLVMTGALTWLLWRRRVEPIRAAAILWLGLFVAGVNWYPNYLNWGLPFFLMTGWVTWVALMEVALLPFCLRYVAGFVEVLNERRAALLVLSAAIAWLMWASRLAAQAARLMPRIRR